VHALADSASVTIRQPREAHTVLFTSVSFLFSFSSAFSFEVVKFHIWDSSIGFGSC